MAQKILDILLALIKKFGYGGVFIATGLEYACFPISSELLLPFIGFAAARNGNPLLPTVIVSTLGGCAGSLICYFIGRFGAKGLSKAFNSQGFKTRFKGLRAGLKAAKDKFVKHGAASVFFARMLPIARTYISIPAGMSKMKISRFLLYTAGGAFLWNLCLITIGFLLGGGQN